MISKIFKDIIFETQYDLLNFTKKSWLRYDYCHLTEFRLRYNYSDDFGNNLAKAMTLKKILFVEDLYALNSELPT